MKRALESITMCLIILSIGLLAGCVSKETHEKGIDRIESISKTKLPKEKEVEYHYYYKAFQGDFQQYTVFKLKEDPAEFLQDNSFIDSTGRSPSLYPFLSGDNIPQEFRPDWQSDNLIITFEVYDSSGSGVMFYFPDICRLIVVMQI